jgi:hypothetical protein
MPRRNRLFLLPFALLAVLIFTAEPATAQFGGIPRAVGDGSTEDPANIRIEWRDRAPVGGTRLAELRITYEGPLAHQYDNCFVRVGVRRLRDAGGWQKPTDYGMQRIHRGIFYLAIPFHSASSGGDALKSIQFAFFSLVPDGRGGAAETWDNGGRDPLAYYECIYLRETISVVDRYPSEESPRNIDMRMHSCFTGGHTVGGTLSVTYRGGLAGKYRAVSLRFGVRYYFDRDGWQDIRQVDLAKTGPDTFEGQVSIFANHGQRGRLLSIQFVFCSPYGPMGSASWDNGGDGPLSYYIYDVSTGTIRVVDP